jgi:beta-glucosidase
MKWPEGFMWGTAASSTQCEGAAPASDWRRWEEAGEVPVSGSGSGFAERYREDFALLASLGLVHHRLSIDWARIEPSEGHRDAAAIDHYREVLTSARDAGITPWVCLHHFTLPAWFADAGGFLESDNRTGHWARHVEFIADEFGDLVGGWQPVNETNYYAMLAYGGKGWPPGRNDRDQALLATEAIHLATAEAAVRLRGSAPVASIYGLSVEHVADDNPDSSWLAARWRDNNWETWLGLVRDGVLRVHGRDPVERPDLAGCFDLIGFSFYANTGFRVGQVVPWPEGAPVSPLGYGIHAAGIADVLARLHHELPDTPLLVAEFGVGTDDDGLRARYLAEGLVAVHDAIAAGVDVRGLFHWTSVDNSEWRHGYDVAFGIIDADRRVKPSARVLADEAQGTSTPAN